MSRTPARFTQADVARAIRAARQTGAGDVTVAKDGSIVIRLSPTNQEGAKELDDEALIRL